MMMWHVSPVAAIEYRRTEFGLPFFGLVPGAITPADWPSQYGILPKWSMMMWHVSPVACAPTMRFVETTLPVWGALFLYVLTGTPDWSEYGDASRKSWLPLGVAVAAAKACRSTRTRSRQGKNKRPN